MEIATARPVERFSHTQAFDNSYHFGSAGTLLQFTTGLGSDRPSCMFSFDNVNPVSIPNTASSMKSSKLLKENAISLSNFNCKKRLDFNRLTLTNTAQLQDENTNNNNNVNSINNNNVENVDILESYSALEKSIQQQQNQHSNLHQSHGHHQKSNLQQSHDHHHTSSLYQSHDHHESPQIQQSNIQQPHGHHQHSSLQQSDGQHEHSNLQQSHSHHQHSSPHQSQGHHQRSQNQQQVPHRRNHQNQIKPLTTAVQRRNERERNRVKLINMTFATLREHIPNGTKGSRSKKMSKVETLKAAIEYIRYLKKLMDEHDVVNAVLDSSVLASSNALAPSGVLMSASILSSSSAMTSPSVLSQPGLSPTPSVSSPHHSSCSDSSCEGISVDEDDLLDFSNWF